MDLPSNGRLFVFLRQHVFIAFPYIFRADLVFLNEETMKSRKGIVVPSNILGVGKNY